MKKISIVILGVFCLGILAAPAVAANHNDFKAIQKAVKKNPAYEAGREAKWLKILITDSRDKEERVSVTLPLSLIELILGGADSRHFKVDDGDCEIDLKALFADLKKAGPAALIEIRDDGALIKIWLE
jgi:sugar phosphate isomerase/epimerase